MTVYGKEVEDLRARSKEAGWISKTWRASTPPQSVAEEYLRRFGADGWVAVRSSAVDEDGATSSYAGEHDSHLGVRGADEVRRARGGGRRPARTVTGSGPSTGVGYGR